MGHYSIPEDGLGERVVLAWQQQRVVLNPWNKRKMQAHQNIFNGGM